MPFWIRQPGMGWERGLVGFLFFLFFVFLVVCCVMMVVRHGSYDHHHGTHHGPSGPAPDSNALKILNERFARGEIDAEEYAKRRDLIKGST